MDGIILVDKEKKMTSHDVVYKIKKIFGEKVGHTGTLDPNATGVLPILIGEGTKMSKYLIEHDKVYKARIKLGIKTDTADVEGQVIKEDEVDKDRLTVPNIQEVLESFIGKTSQIPPMHSAIKVNGKKLYEYARKGITVDVKPRIIEIFSIKLDNIDLDNLRIDFTVHCSKGTYIRSLCEDIAEKLNTVGYMEELERVKVGNFSIDSAVKLSELEENKNNEEYIKKHFITIEKFFDNKKDIHLSERRLQLFLNGVKITEEKEDGIYRIYNNNSYVGIGVIEDNLLKRDIISYNLL